MQKRFPTRKILLTLLTAAAVLALAFTVTACAVETGGEDPEPAAVSEPEPAAVSEPEPEQEQDLSVSLLYDDRYSFAGTVGDGFRITDIRTEEITSYRVSGGAVTSEPDTAVLTRTSDTDVIATGVGTAVVTLTDAAEDTEQAVEDGNTVTVTVTVDPAPLTVMFLTGQSNMEGYSASYDWGASVLCAEGQVYSTYVPFDAMSSMIGNTDFREVATADNAADFVAESLTSDISRSGSELEYGLDSLTASGRGKSGMDSALAYEWNRLTGEKVWLVNTACSGTFIRQWIPGGDCYQRATAVNDLALQTFQAELDAGHYEKGSIFLFWLQGEYDKYMAAEDYEGYFRQMYTAFSEAYDLTAVGLIPPRSCVASCTGPDDLYMTGPRIAQYGIGSSEEYSNVYVISNVNEQWVTDEGTAAYFAGAYPDGFTYPFHSGAELSLPTTVAEVHPDIHYAQIGYNENGITAADGLYTALYSGESASSVSWMDSAGTPVSDVYLDLSTSETGLAVPVADPVSLGKTVRYSLTDNLADYDPAFGTVTPLAAGDVEILAVGGSGSVAGLSVHVVGDKQPGFVERNGVWYCYDEDGNPIDSGVVLDSTGEVYDTGEPTWWYIQDSKPAVTYYGFVENGDDCLYASGGQISYRETGLVYGAVRASYGWWYIEDSRCTFDYTGLAENEYGIWYVVNSKADLSYTGTVTDSSGTWNVVNGQVVSGPD